MKTQPDFIDELFDRISDQLHKQGEHVRPSAWRQMRSNVKEKFNTAFTQALRG